MVKVGRCGICGSDLHMTEDPAFGRGAGDVLGHEFAGEVVALGKGAEGIALGDLVSVIPLASCGRCASCLAGEPAWCAHFGLQGGGYAEYALTRPNQCVTLPRSASLADGAIIEPLAVALHGVNMSGLKTGDRMLVLGAGPIGLAVAFWARRLGAGRVVVQDVVALQEERALAMGATAFVVDPRRPGRRLRSRARRQGRHRLRMRRHSRPDRPGGRPGPQPRHDPAARPVHPARHVRQLRHAVQGDPPGHLGLLHPPGI